MSDGKKNKSKKNKSGFRRIIGKIILVFMLAVLLAVIAGGIWFYNKYGRDLLALKDRAHMLVAKSDESVFRTSETSVCYYQDGTIMSVLKGSRDSYYISYEAIPEDVINAFLAVEDRKFWTHSGYDVYAIGRAAKAYLKNEGRITQGGSTITQQLARLTFLTNEKTVERKVTEIFVASELEKRYSKEQILEFYINNIYYSNGYYGIQAAAMGYFGKSVDELTLSQTAFLCGIPNSPSDYNPVKRFDSTMKRRDSVLKQMRENGYISGTEYNEALQEEIVPVSTRYERRDYAETFTYYCAVQALMRAEGFNIRTSFTDDADREEYEELYDEEYYRLKRSLYTGGYRIYTSLNPKKQQQLQESVNSVLADFDETGDDGMYALQASAVCIDNETGFVAAIIGGRGQEYDGYTLNRAFQSPRQPGSSVKPLIVYTPAFENGYYPDTHVIDERFEGGPRNSGGVYSGEIELRYAVAVSKNTVAWKLFEELTPRAGLDYLKRMNFSHLSNRDYVPAAALGGLTYGATALEMTSAYAALENQGVFRTPTCVLRISDADGATVIDNTEATARAACSAGNAYGGCSVTASGALCSAGETRIYQRNASLMMTDVLKTVMTSGTGRRLALEGITSAGKTGTTNDQKDGWFVGYTNYYTTGVWVGYDYPRAMEELMGNTYPGYIWHDFMEKIHNGLKDADFEPYNDPRPKPEPAEEGEETGESDENDDGDTDGYGMDGDISAGEDGTGYGSNTDEIGYGDNSETDRFFNDNVLYFGEDGSRIILYEGFDSEAPLDREGKPAYYDDDGNRIYYDIKGNAVTVAPDGMPSDYFTGDGWILYDKDGNPVIERTYTEKRG